MTKTSSNTFRRIVAAAFLALAVACTALAKDPSPQDRIYRHKASPAETGERKKEADLHASRAREAFLQGRYGDVISAGTSALEIYTSIGDDAGEMKVLHDLGRAHRKMADYTEAERLHQRALDLAQRGGDRSMHGTALIDIGDVRERRKDHPGALSFYRKALEILRLPEDWKEAGRALRQIGDIQVVRGDFEEAYDAYGSALRYAGEGHDPSAIAESRDYTGYFFRQMGDYEKAADLHRRTLEAAAEIPDTQERSRCRARALNHLGLCTARLASVAAADGDLKTAAKRYREAASLEEEALREARSASDRWRQGYVLRASAQIHRELGELSPGTDASRDFAVSLARAGEAIALAAEMKEKEWQGLGLHQKAIALALLGRHEEGLASLREAIGLWNASGDLQGMGQAWQLIAHRIHEARGKLPEALDAYGKALETFERIRAFEHISAIHLGRGAIFERRGELAKAKDSYMASIEALESVRSRLTSEEHKIAFFERRQGPYDALISLLARMHREGGRREDGALALHISERARERTMLDLIRGASGLIRGGVDAATLAREADIRSGIRSLSGELLRERDPKKSDAMKTDLDRLLVERNAFLRELEGKYPAYARLKNPRPLEMEEIRSRTLGEGVRLLEYFVGERGTFLFVVSREGLEVLHPIPIGKRELAAKVEALRSPFEQIKTGGNIQDLEKFDLALARDLYGLLLAPVEKHVRGASGIVIVPHGPLYHLPFELLVRDLDARPMPEGIVFGRFETPRYAVEALPPVAYGLSASLLDPGLRRTGDGAPKGTLIAFGNPTPERADGKRRGVRMRRGHRIMMPGLPFAEREARAVASLYDGGTKVYLGMDATKARFLSEAGGYRSVILSTHGILDERDPMFSGLVFAPRPGEEDGSLLETHEIFNIRLNADLVTLSACEAGLGRIRDGEGLIGMGQAFIYAGASSLVVSLWSVYDRSTSQLITGFHEGVRVDPSRKAHALRESKLETIRKRERLESGHVLSYAHPFFWAPFVLFRGP
ncbi:MAG: CHAT domain-containing protein [Deltaproteobacteria bacterium]|nr:CHAT domain-containing protein [Deltaproteobacteria bacterium]